MKSVDEALKIILDSIKTLGTEEKNILDSLGQVSAQNVYSSINVPPYDNSAMDGYAVDAEFIQNASGKEPVYLKVVGEIAAGNNPQILVERDKCVRIMTGAAIPEGASAVVPIEKTTLKIRKSINSSIVAILEPVNAGANIRRAGEDIKAGAVIIRRGTLLRAYEIGLLASIGVNRIKVYRRPIVSIITTGNELVEPGEYLERGKIFNSNAYTIACLVRASGGVAKIIGTAVDKKQDIIKLIKNASSCDLIVTTGGVSVGEYDIVKEVLKSHGDISFWKVRMKPGKPLVFGHFFRDDIRRKIPVLGLPGNPVSCVLDFELFGRPAVFKMMGRKDYRRPVIKAYLNDKIVNEDGRRIFARVHLQRKGKRFIAKLTGEQGSGILTSMVKADGLAIIPEDVSEINPGEEVNVILLDRAGNHDIRCC